MSWCVMPWFKLAQREGGVVLPVPLHTTIIIIFYFTYKAQYQLGYFQRRGETSAAKDYGEMLLDVYVPFITIYSMLWSPLVSSIQIIQFMCNLHSKNQQSTSSVLGSL